MGDSKIVNDKRDSGTKFTSPELCVPFAQTVNRSVFPCTAVNGKQSIFPFFKRVDGG